MLKAISSAIFYLSSVLLFFLALIGLVIIRPIYKENDSPLIPSLNQPPANKQTKFYFFLIYVGGIFISPYIVTVSTVSNVFYPILY